MLSSVKPSRVPGSAQHRARAAAVDALARFPVSEALRPHAAAVAAGCVTGALAAEGEADDVGGSAARLALDLHKAFRSPELEAAAVAPFMAFVTKLYSDVPALVGRFVDPGEKEKMEKKKQKEGEEKMEEGG